MQRLFFFQMNMYVHLHGLQYTCDMFIETELTHSDAVDQCFSMGGVTSRRCLENVRGRWKQYFCKWGTGVFLEAFVSLQQTSRQVKILHLLIICSNSYNSPANTNTTMRGSVSFCSKTALYLVFLSALCYLHGEQDHQHSL